MATITKLHPTHSQLLEMGFVKDTWGEKDNHFTLETDNMTLYLQFDSDFNLAQIVPEIKPIAREYYTIPRIFEIVNALDLTKEIVQ